ncbi:CRISPR-associated endonuclease Cas1 [Acidaminococcus timonensis]|uniref:CRISPR-associated endonuclease Cas1 n=1 Tax=Acidaminococcus timonensis TaxID=1871002 RepID=UPI003A5C662A
MILLSFAYVTEKGTLITHKAGRFVVSRNSEVLMEIPEETLDGLVLIDTVQVSSQAMVSFLHLGIPVTWLSTTGKFFGRLESTSHIRIFKQRQQFLLQDSPFALEICRKTLFAKVHNQLTLLRRYNRERDIPEVKMDIRNIAMMGTRLREARSRDELMGYEGISAKIYFSALGKLITPDFHFDGRSKRPPRDPFNSMLSLAYTLILYELFTSITNEGLHPYVGFMHALREDHPALASDLLEEWRPILADSFVLSLVQHHEILLEHFYRDEENGGVFLTSEGRKIFFRAYERKMRSTNQYLQGTHSYRRSLAYQAAQYSQALMGEDASIYEPIWIR